MKRFGFFYKIRTEKVKWGLVAENLESKKLFKEFDDKTKLKFWRFSYFFCGTSLL